MISCGNYFDTQLLNGRHSRLTVGIRAGAGAGAGLGLRAPVHYLYTYPAKSASQYPGSRFEQS